MAWPDSSSKILTNNKITMIGRENSLFVILYIYNDPAYSVLHFNPLPPIILLLLFVLSVSIKSSHFPAGKIEFPYSSLSSYQSLEIKNYTGM